MKNLRMQLNQNKILGFLVLSDIKYRRFKSIPCHCDEDMNMNNGFLKLSVFLHQVKKKNLF